MRFLKVGEQRTPRDQKGIKTKRCYNKATTTSTCIPLPPLLRLNLSDKYYLTNLQNIGTDEDFTSLDYS